MLLLGKPCSRYQKLMRQRKQRQQAMQSAATRFGKSSSVLGDRNIKCSLPFVYHKPETVET